MADMRVKATPEEAKRDKAFAAWLTKASKLESESAHQTVQFDGKTAVDVSIKEKVGGKELRATKLTFPAGIYSKDAAIEFLRTYAGIKESDPKPTALRELRLKSFVSYKDGGGFCTQDLKSFVSISSPPKLFSLAGNILDSPMLTPITSPEQYTALVDAIGAKCNFNNTWCRDRLDAEVAHMAPASLEMLEFCRQQVSKLGYVGVMAISPRILRYYSDGSAESQTDALRLAPVDDGSGMRPLLYDGPAWALSLNIFDSPLNGRVFVNEAGEFVASDWCQRTTPDSKETGIDLYNGKSSKHTLLSWCAGPAMKWAPANATKQQGLRRARIVVATSFDDLLENNMTLLKLAAYLNDKEKCLPAKRVFTGTTVVAIVDRKYPAQMSAQLWALAYFKYNVVILLWTAKLSWTPGSDILPKIDTVRLYGSAQSFPSEAIALPADLANTLLSRQTTLVGIPNGAGALDEHGHPLPFSNEEASEVASEDALTSDVEYVEEEK